MSNFNRKSSFLILLALLLFSLPGLGVGLHYSTPLPEDFAQAREKYVLQMKHQAVINWLEKYLSGKNLELLQQLPPKEAEKYILDYQLRRFFSDSPQIELTGHLDKEALKKWIRLTKAKSSGTGLRPFFIVSSSIPSHPLSAKETATQVASNPLAQATYRLMDSLLGEYNIRAVVKHLRRFTYSYPKNSKSQIAYLRDFGFAEGFNSALWVHYAPCTNCAGTKMYLYFYHLPKLRAVVTKAYELPIKPTEIGNEAALRKAMIKPMADLRIQLNNLIGSGTLSSLTVRLYVEKIPSLRVLKQVEKEVKKMDFVLQILLRTAAPGTAEFEVKTPLSLTEFSQRLSQSYLNGLSLKVVRVDSDALVVRYLQ